MFTGVVMLIFVYSASCCRGLYRQVVFIHRWSVTVDCMSNLKNVRYIKNN